MILKETLFGGATTRPVTMPKVWRRLAGGSTFTIMGDEQGEGPLSSPNSVYAIPQADYSLYILHGGSLMNRREMIKGAVAGSGLAALSKANLGALGSESTTASGETMPTAVLGRTGVKVSRLGIGCAQFGRNDDMGVEEVRALLHRALDLGITYFDTAPNYGRSEEKMGPTIKEIRDKIFLVTKLEEPSYEGARELIRQSMNRLQTDHLDLVHLHNIGLEERFPDLDFTFSDKGALGALREAKKKGVVRFIGASGHLYPSRFHPVLDTGDIDVIMNAVNYIVRHVYNFEDKVWSRARQQNVGLVAMKVLGGGSQTFSMPKESYEKAIRYALSVPGVSTAVIGLQSIPEVEKAVRTVIAAKPFSEEEAAKVNREGFEMARTDRWRRPYGNPVT